MGIISTDSVKSRRPLSQYRDENYGLNLTEQLGSDYGSKGYLYQKHQRPERGAKGMEGKCVGWVTGNQEKLDWMFRPKLDRQVGLDGLVQKVEGQIKRN